MRKEAENWMKQAESDMKNAELMYNSGAYDIASFLSHQLAEKALKAYYIYSRKEFPNKTHNLKEYAEAINELPAELAIYCRDLTPHYIVSRYPDAAAGVPAEIYTKNIAKDLLQKAKKVLEWSKNQMK